MPTERQVKNALKKVVDPELGYDIIYLGLVRKVSVKNDRVKIVMTLTTPYCPFGNLILAQTEQSVKNLKGVKDCKIELTFDPPWEPSEELKTMLGVN